jgi:TPR repeat protein
MYGYGCCLENGKGVTKNVQEALNYYSMAADKGNSDAKNALRRLHK